MGRLQTNAYYALGASLYVLLIGLEYWVARRRNVRVFGFADTVSNLSAGMGEVVIGLFLGPLLIGKQFAACALIAGFFGSSLVWLRRAATPRSRLQ